MTENIDRKPLTCAYCVGSIRPVNFGNEIFFCCPYGCTILKSSKEPAIDTSDDDFDHFLEMVLSF